MTADRVVVGYDGGTGGADAVAFARRWSTASGDEIVVVAVHPGPGPVGPQRVDAEWVAYEREAAGSLLDEAQAALDGTPATFRRVDASSAARGLHEVVEDRRDSTPLIVLGGRRGGSPRRTSPGTTAQRLLSGTSVPVALVPRDYGAEPAAELSRVLLAYLDTPDGRVALDWAIRIARHLSATLTVVTVVPDTLVQPTLGEPRVFADEQRAVFAAANTDAVEVARSAGVTADGALPGGVVHEVLAGLGPERGDLLVLGSRGYGPVRSVLLGGVSSRVVRSARSPVVLVPRGES